MAKVLLENVYKNFSSRSNNQAIATSKDSLERSPLPDNSIEAIKTNRGQLQVLKGINLTIKDGEFMVLVGPSGCGKSTLLRLIAGLETVTGGKIWLGDRLINSLPPKARDIAMVFQNYALYPHLSVYDNIAFGLRRTSQTDQNLSLWRENLLVGMTRSLPRPFRYQSAQERQIEQQVNQVAQLLQIEPLLDRFPKQLSGGQRQRVALGRAIARNPQVFLMDEPLSNLDAKLRTETRAQIVKLQRTLQTTTIYVTHDQTEAMTMGDRIAVMSGGEIQQIAPPLEIYNHPANRFVAQFIGSPPMNFISVKLEGLVVVHPQFRFTLPEIWTETLQAYRERNLLLGIRPEHFSLSVPAPKNLPVVVDLVEALGNDTFISGQIEHSKETIQARVSPDYTVKTGQTVWLALNINKLHFFDPDTEKGIYNGGHSIDIRTD